jgi:hypothetical protein
MRGGLRVGGFGSTAAITVFRASTTCAQKITSTECCQATNKSTSFYHGKLFPLSRKFSIKNPNIIFELQTGH